MALANDSDLPSADDLPLAHDVPLAPLTTLELGGAARHLVTAADEATVLKALRWASARALPVLALGGAQIW